MSALEIEAAKRPATVNDWINKLEAASEDISENKTAGNARLVIMAPEGAEVYVNDERKGSIGSSGRLILTTVPMGQHILRVSKPGEKDDERVIEIREGANEQVIQAQLKSVRQQGSQPSPSQRRRQQCRTIEPDAGNCRLHELQREIRRRRKVLRSLRKYSFCLDQRGRNSASRSIVRAVKTLLPANSKFCGRCGMSFNQTGSLPNSLPVGFKSSQSQNIPRTVEKICPRCNTIYAAHIKFCGRCGREI